MVNRIWIAAFAGALLAHTVWAQDIYEPDDGAANARPVTGNIREMDHTIHTPGDEDWFALNLAVPTTVVVEVNRPPDGTGSLIIRRVDSELNELPCNNCDDEGRAIDFPAGLWYIVLKEDSGGTVSNYEVAISLYPEEPDAFEPDNTMMDARPLVAGEFQRGHSIMPAGEEDWYFFDVQTKGTQSEIVVDIQTPVRDMTFTYFDENGDEQFLGEPFNRDVDSLFSGRYFLRVTNLDGSLAVPDYRIVMWEFPNPDPYEDDDTPATASAIGVEGAEHTRFGQGQIRSLYPEGDEDWIQFYVEDVTRIRIETGRFFGLDPVMEIYDATGQTLLAGPSDLRLEYDDPPDGFYLARFRHPGEFPYEPTAYSIEVTTVPIPRLTQGSLAGIVVSNSKQTPLPEAMVTVNGQVNISATTDSAGAFLVPVLPQGPYTVEASAEGYQSASVIANVGASVAAVNIALDLFELPEDLNGDNLVNAVDVQLVINSALGLRGPADVNNDGSTNAVDVQLVINAALGLSR